MTRIPASARVRAAVEAGGATAIPFVLVGTTVRPVRGATVTVRAGDSVAFVPADERTRQALDAGEIAIYSDAWNGPPLSPSRANELREPSYMFLAAGTFHFAPVYLPAVHSWVDVLQPTFTVVVRPP